MALDRKSETYLAYLEEEFRKTPSQLTDTPELDDPEPEPPEAFNGEFTHEYMTQDPFEGLTDDDIVETAEFPHPRVKRLLYQAFGIFVLTIFGLSFVYALIEGARVL